MPVSGRGDADEGSFAHAGFGQAGSARPGVRPIGPGVALDDTIALLEQAPIVGLFGRDALRLLAFSAETRRLRTGETVFRRGDRSDGGYVVLTGRLGLTGRSGQPATIVGPGALVGRVALFVRTQRPVTAVALDASEVLRVSPTLLRRVLAEFPDAAGRMRDLMAEDLSDLSADLERIRLRLLSVGRSGE